MSNKKPLHNTNNGLIKEFSDYDSISVKHGGTGLNNIPKDNTIVGYLPDSVRTIKNNYNASTKPTNLNDIKDGYSIGSKWYDITNKIEYTCVDNTLNNAIWNSSSGISVVNWNDIQNTPNTINEYGITDAYTKTEVNNLIDNQTIDWSDVQNTPNTINEYGITDAYTKTEIDEHTNNTVIHVTQEDRDRWDSYYNAITNTYVYYVGSIGDTVITLTHNLGTDNYEVSYVDMNTNSNIVLIGEQNSNTLILDDLSPLIINKQLKVIIKCLI